MRHSIILGVVFLLMTNLSLAQKDQELQVGDTISNLKLKNVLNYKKQSIHLSEFKNKVLIIEFWATWCKPCIASMPKGDSLQKKYADSLQILYVTNENRKAVTELFIKMRKVWNVSPTTIIGDNLLVSIFPHTYLPHLIWIDKRGKIIAVTDQSALSESNIVSMIRDHPVSFSSKKDNKYIVSADSAGRIFTPYVTLSKPDRQLEEIKDSSLLLTSILTGHINGGVAGGSFRNNSISFINNSIISLYKWVLFGSGIEGMNQKKTVIEVSDTSLVNKITQPRFITQDEKTAWINANTYCYELRVSNELAEGKFSIASESLNKYFGSKLGIEGIVQKRMQKYLALIHTGDDNLLRTRQAESKFEINQFYLKITNSSTATLIWELATPLQEMPPIIDESNIKFPIDLELNCQLTDLKALNKELDRYGLQLVEKEKPMDVAVIRMKK